MADTAVKLFSKSFREQFNRLPVWTPGTDIRVGDIGIVDDGGWQKAGTLDQHGITFAPSPGTAKVNYDLTTSRGVQVTTKLDAAMTLEGVAPVNAGIGFRFASSGAFAFTAVGCVVTQMENLISVLQQMLTRAMHGGWNEKWVVATTAVAAKRSIMAVSGSNASEANLDLGIDLSSITGTASVGLGKAAANAGFTVRKEMAATFLALEPAVVMYEAWHIHMGLWSTKPEPYREFRYLEPRQMDPKLVPVVSPVIEF